MTDYTKLVEALRILQDKNSLSYYKRQVCKDAADAIEALQAEVAALKHDIERYVQMNTELLNDRPELEEIGGKWVWKLPKRGEIVRCMECIHFTQGGWCDREFDWFPVDENDFCSMAEKMEVQE